MFIVLAIGDSVFMVMVIPSSSDGDSIFAGMLVLLRLVMLMEWHSWCLHCHLFHKNSGGTHGLLITWRACGCMLAGWFIVACSWSLVPGHLCLTRAGEGVPFPLDKTLPSGSSCSCLHLHTLPPAPAVLTSCLTSPLRCLVVEGISRRWHLPCQKSSPGDVLGVASSEVSSALSISKETCAFILKNCDVIKPLFRSMMSSFCILIGCQGNSDAP